MRIPEQSSRENKLAIVAVVLVVVFSTVFRYVTSHQRTKEQADTTYSRVQYDERFSVEIGDDWRTVSEDGFVFYVADNGRQMFWASEVVSDHGRSAEESFDSIVKELGGELRSGLSEELYDKNGVAYRTACLLTTLDNTEPAVSMEVLVQVIICEQKNIVFYLMARCSNDKYLDETAEELYKMCQSIEFTDTPDVVTGRTFYMDMEKLTAELHDDGTFLIYQDKAQADTWHISGTYEVYRGREAVEKVDSMTDYGLTAEEQKRTINSSVSFWDDYYAVIFSATDAAQDGESIELEASLLYVGFANKIPDALLMTSCDKFINESWTYVE